MGPNLTRLFEQAKNRGDSFVGPQAKRYYYSISGRLFPSKLEILFGEHGNALVEALEVAPDFGGEPTTAFGHEYREWQSATKRLLATLEREASKP